MEGAKSCYLVVSPPPSEYSLIELGDGSGEASTNQEVNFIKIGDYDESQIINRVQKYITHNPAFEWRPIVIQNCQNKLINPKQNWKIGTKLQNSVLLQPKFKPPQDGREWFRTINHRMQLETLLEVLDEVSRTKNAFQQVLKSILKGTWPGKTEPQLLIINALLNLEQQQRNVVLSWIERPEWLLRVIQNATDKSDKLRQIQLGYFEQTIKNLTQEFRQIIYFTATQDIPSALQSCLSQMCNIIETLKPWLLPENEFIFPQRIELDNVKRGLSQSIQHLNQIIGIGQFPDINSRLKWMYKNVDILVALNSEGDISFLNESVAILFFDYFLNLAL